MDEKQTIEQIKTRLSKFLEDIDHVNPDEVSVKDIDEWIGLLDQLEEKVKLVSKQLWSMKKFLTKFNIYV